MGADEPPLRTFSLLGVTSVPFFFSCSFSAQQPRSHPQHPSMLESLRMLISKHCSPVTPRLPVTPNTSQGRLHPGPIQLHTSVFSWGSYDFYIKKNQILGVFYKLLMRPVLRSPSHVLAQSRQQSAHSPVLPLPPPGLGELSGASGLTSLSSYSMVSLLWGHTGELLVRCGCSANTSSLLYPLP